MIALDHDKNICTEVRPTRRLVNRFRASVAGSALIEFAFLAPLMLIITFGTFEVGRSIVVHKRFQRAAAMVGDLVAREQQLGTTTTEAKAALDGIVTAAERVMAPYDATQFRVGIMSVRSATNNANNTTVTWSYSPANHQLNVAQCPQTKALPSTGMIETNSHAIIVEAEYQYTPIFTDLITWLVPFNWENRVFRDTVTNAPRNGCVQYGSHACNQTGCPPSS